MKVRYSKIATLLIQIGIAITLVAYVPDFCLKQTDGFSVCRLQSAFPSDPSWNIAPLPQAEREAVALALRQPYHYLGFGGQCYAFESEDGQYVVKFFKHHLRKPQAWLIGLSWPQPLRLRWDKLYHRLRNKHYRDYTSYKLAYDLLKEETGLLYIHLNKTTDLNEQLTFTDKLGIAHQIDLDQTEFIVQRKAQLVYPSFAEMVGKRDLEQVKRSLRSIFDLIISRCKKGVYDEDPRIHCNVGLVGTDAIFIDVGRFRMDQRRTNRDVYLHDLTTITERFKGWIQENYPELIPLFEEEVEKSCENC